MINGIPTVPGSSPSSATQTVTLAGALAAQTVSGSAATATTATTRAALAFTSTKGLGRKVKVTTTVSAAAYTAGSIITVTGTDVSGNAQTDTLTLIAAGGGDAISTAKFFATVSTIDIPAQGTTAGALAFTATDFSISSCRQIRVGTAGSGALHVGYSGSNGTIQDTITGCTAGERFDTRPTILYIDSTVQDVTLFF